MKKRLLALCLTVILAVSVFPFCVSAARDEESEPNGTMETATLVSLNNTATGYISVGKNLSGYKVPMDTDWLKYEIPAEGYFYITLMPSATDSIKLYDYWFFSLYDESGNQMGSTIKIDILGGAERSMPVVHTTGKCDLYMKITGKNDFEGISHSIIDQKTYYIRNTFECAHTGHQNDTLVREVTCSQEGKIEWRCDDCGEVSKTDYIEKLAHTPGEWEVTKEATCAVNGRQVKICSVCGATAETEDIAKLEHTPGGEWEETKPTCAEEGRRVLRCTVCGDVAKEEEIAKLEHTPGDEWEETEPTCAEEGRRVLKCTVCGGVAKEEPLAKLAHTYGEWEVFIPASCNRDGEQWRRCTVCGSGEKGKIKGEHNWGDWKLEAKATCASAGRQARSCKNCGETQTKSIDKLEHSYGSSSWEVVTKATCTTAGSERLKCQSCGATETRATPAIGHKFGSWTQENGRNIHRCSVCNYVEAEKLSGERSEVSVTKANSTTPTVIVLVVPAFSDVSSTSWYQSVVTYAYNLGLMVGNSETTFNPLGNMTVGEAVTMAARARNSYDGGTNKDFKDPATGKAWYQPYVDYAVKKNIMKQGDFDNYERVATRSEMAYLFANALPDAGMKAINKVTSLPDVNKETKYSQEIFKLYNAGIITGSDDKGTFSPDKPITRSEAAAIITRVTLSSERKTLALK